MRCDLVSFRWPIMHTCINCTGMYSVSAIKQNGVETQIEEIKKKKITTTTKLNNSNKFNENKLFITYVA